VKKYGWCWVVTIVAALSLFACKSETVMQPTKVNSAAEAKSEKDSVRQVSGKPGASVTLKSPQPLLLADTGVQDVRFQLISPIHNGTMNVSVTANEGISIISEMREFTFSLNESDNYQIPLTLNIAHEGRHYVQLYITVNNGGQTSVRSLAVILQVGKAAIKVQKPAIESSVGSSEQVISLPAQETISPR
jgi:hypothetical protein